MATKTSISQLQAQLNKHKAPVKVVKEPTKEEVSRFADDTGDLFEDEKQEDVTVEETPTFNPTVAFEEAESVSKKTTNVSIERYLAILMKHGLRVGTAYLFKPHNAMTEVEAGSTTIPTIRMLQRRIDKWLKINLPFNKMDKADKADIEEIVTAVGNYLIRISAQAIDRWVARLTNQQPRPINAVRTQSHAPLTPHEQNVQAHMQARNEAITEYPNGNQPLTQEAKEALIAMYSGIEGMEG